MNKQVLVAGNDLMLFQAMRSYMLGENIAVSYAETIADAVESILKQEFCLVIIAIQPSEREDVKLLRIIRNSKGMPIIILADPCPVEAYLAPPSK